MNDNPVNWFKPEHPLRVADQVMNEHLAGTYLAYLEVAGEEDGPSWSPSAMAWVRATCRTT